MKNSNATCYNCKKKSCNNNDLSKRFEAYCQTGNKNEIIDKIYGYLDLIDRKSSAIITINSINIAMSSAYVIKNIDKYNFLYFYKKNNITISIFILSFTISMVVIIKLLSVFRLKWSFMEKSYINEKIDYDKEISSLSCVAYKRYKSVAFGWKISLYNAYVIITAMIMIISKGLS